jgi:hypothetical protein
MYYGADQKLYVLQKYVFNSSNETRGVYEEYRYDALGRRVLLRAWQDTICNTECNSHITRTVWDGDHILHEMRAPGGNNDNPESLSGSGRLFGRVTYTHGPTIDQPLGLIRYNYNTIGLYSPFLITPHRNWRGCPTAERGRTDPRSIARAATGASAS